jgi:hypothetical protein
MIYYKTLPPEQDGHDLLFDLSELSHFSLLGSHNLLRVLSHIECALFEAL